MRLAAFPHANPAFFPSLGDSIPSRSRYEVLEVMNLAKTDLVEGNAYYTETQNQVFPPLLAAHLRSFGGNFWSAHLRFFRCVGG